MPSDPYRGDWNRIQQTSRRMTAKLENRLRAAGVQFPGAGAIWNSKAKVLIDGLRLAAQRGTNPHGVPTTITLTLPNITRKN